MGKNDLRRAALLAELRQAEIEFLRAAGWRQVAEGPNGWSKTTDEDPWSREIWTTGAALQAERPEDE